MMKGTRGNFIIKMIMEDFDKYFDKRFTCPFPAQTFGLYGFTPNTKYLPSILLNRHIKFQLIVKVEGKWLNSTRIVTLFTFKLHGEVGAS